MSIQAIDQVHDSSETAKKDLVHEVEESNDLRDRSNWDGSEDREDPDQVKHKLCGLFGALYHSVYRIPLTM